MSIFAVVVCLANLALIALLPRIFFRRDGRFNLMWCVTAAPFVISGLGLILCATGVTSPWHAKARGLHTALQLVGVVLAVGSVGCIGFTLGTHRRPLALWHQENDQPQHIVTWGAYGRVRHPFYASFLLTLLAIAIACPHVMTWFALIYALVVLSWTAAREERRLSASEFGDEYRAYARRSGRFLPFVRHARHE